MRRHRADILAVAIIVAACLVTAWPLLARLEGVPPDDDDLDLDLMSYYGYAEAARTTALKFHQFPLRSPWHGGGYPLYAYPDDFTLTPTMLLVLAAGPWAAIKIDFVLTMLVAGLGMYLLTRHRMRYPPAAALLSATAFALGGFLLARWLRGWRVPTHAVWLPLILYALWRGRERRAWLALAAALVAWLIIDHKYVAIVMGWFLLMVGLLRLDEETPRDARPAWGYFARLAAVWGFGVGLAAVKLIPMAPLLQAHLQVENEGVRPSEMPQAVAFWLVLFAALGVAPLLGRLVAGRRTRLLGLGGVVLAVVVVLAAAALWTPPRRPNAPPAAQWIREVADSQLSFGTWRQNQTGQWTPTASDKYRARSPVGPIVALLAVVGVVLRPRQTWKWAVLAGLFLVFELGPALPRELGESVRRLPFLSWLRRPREQLNFYLFFLLALLAGRALDWTKKGVGSLCLSSVAWAVVAANAAFLGYNGYARYRYSVSATAPPARAWGEYQLLDRPWLDPVAKTGRWANQPAFLLREDIGLQYWDLDFRDSRRDFLRPTLLVRPDGIWRPISPPPPLAAFDDPVNRADVVAFTPNEIVLHVHVARPDVLTINQIGDDDWQVEGASLVPRSSLLLLKVETLGEYDVRLTYVPALLQGGLAITVIVAVVGLGILVLTRKRRKA